MCVPCDLCSAGYETDNDSSEEVHSSSNSHGGEEGEGEGGEREGEREREYESLTISITEAERDNERGDVTNQLSTESLEVKRSPEGSSGKGKERRPFLERLKLTRRSNSPDRGGREEGEGGGIMMSVRRGLQSLNGERLAVVGRRGEGEEVGESGEFGEGGGEVGENGEVGERVRGGEEGDQQMEKSDDYRFTLALVSRRSRYRAGES